MKRVRDLDTTPSKLKVEAFLSSPAPNEAGSLETDRAHFLKTCQVAVTRLTDHDRALPEMRALREKARLPARLGDGVQADGIPPGDREHPDRHRRAMSLQGGLAWYF
jgi:hypothetical protein